MASEAGSFCLVDETNFCHMVAKTSASQETEYYFLIPPDCLIDLISFLKK